MNSKIFKKILLKFIIILLIGTLIASGFSLKDIVNYKQQITSDPLDSYLIGYWKFDEGSGTTVYDSSGNGNNGVITGGEQWVDGISGDALFFDGVDNCVEITDTSDFEFENESVSFSVWVQIKDNADLYRTIIILGDSSDSGYPNIDLSKGRSAFHSGSFYGQQYPTNPGGNFSYVYSIDDGDTCPKDQWLHLVQVIDYANSTQKLYLNGILQDTDTCIPFNMSAATSLKLRIGRANWVGYSNYDPHYGLIDEVRIYNKALSDSEIQVLFDMFNLFGYWSFNDGTADDSSGHNRDGVIYGATYNSSGGPDNSGCFEFDGSDYIDISDTADLAFSNQDFSIACWAQIYDNADDYRYFVTLGDPEYTNFNFAIIGKLRSGANQGKLSVALHDNPSNQYGVRSNLTGNELPKYQWFHLVGVYDYNNNQTKMYYNSVLQADIDSLEYFDLSSTPLDLNIGRFICSYDYNWHVGQLDEVRIYSKALSQSEINDLYDIFSSNQIPIVAITYPEMWQQVSGEITINGTANDTDGTVQLVEIRIDSGSWNPATGTNTWNYNWDTTTVTNDLHTIYARSYDGEAYSNINSVIVNVSNNIPPTVEITSPEEGETVSGETTISGTASDTDGTVQSVEIRIDNENWNNATGTTGWTYDWNTSLYSDGVHSIYARSFDGDDYSTLDWINVNVDNDPGNTAPEKPTTPQGPISLNKNEEGTYSTSAIDPDDDMVQYRFDWGDGNISDWTDLVSSGSTAGKTYTWTNSGNYEIKSQARDEYDGKSFWSDPITITVINQPPIADFTWNPEFPDIDEIIIFDASASYDPDGEIYLYEWDWDDDGEYDELSTIPSVQHSWSESGTYPVNLRINDNDDTSVTATKTVFVGIGVPNVKSISGGFRVSAIIENIGNDNATNLEWSIDLEGGLIINGGHSEGTINNLNPGQERLIRQRSLFAIGHNVKITVKTGESTKQANANWILGPLVIGVI